MHPVGVGDDVIVGEDIAVFRDDKARATRFLRLGARRAELLEEIFEARRHAPAHARVGHDFRIARRRDRNDGLRHVLGDGDEAIAEIRDRPRGLGGGSRGRLREALVRQVEARGDQETAKNAPTITPPIRALANAGDIDISGAKGYSNLHQPGRQSSARPCCPDVRECA